MPCHSCIERESSCPSILYRVPRNVCLLASFPLLLVCLVPTLRFPRPPMMWCSRGLGVFPCGTHTAVHDLGWFDNPYNAARHWLVVLEHVFYSTW